MERTCDEVDCGVGAFCRSSTSGDGYECVCDAAYIPNVAQNEAVSCTERTCSNIGSDINSCGANAVCNDGVSIGIRCDCESDAFKGLSVWNGAATCVEKTCVDASCPRGSTCDDTGVEPGYECHCDNGYIPDHAANGAPLTCIRRTCSNPGFTPVNTCGAHSMCTDTDDGIECSCEGAFKGATVVNCLLYTSDAADE